VLQAYPCGSTKHAVTEGAKDNHKPVPDRSRMQGTAAAEEATLVKCTSPTLVTLLRSSVELAETEERRRVTSVGLVYLTRQHLMSATS
jgi:hypothetical protein